MNKEQLLDSFSYLDEELIERSEHRKAPAAWRKWAGAAACLALAAVLVIPAAVRANPRGSSVTTLQPDETWESRVESYQPDTIEDAAGDPKTTGNMAMLPDNASSALDITPMIESYPVNYEACYVTPKNGETNRSIPLRGAMELYGDGARYRVVVDLFRDEQPLPAEGFEARDEIDRLSALGYASGLERYYDHDVLESAYFTLHATYDQLESFAASADYGYMLFLYAERVPDYDPDTPVVFSPGSAAVDKAPADIVEFTPPAELSVDGAVLAVCPPDTSDVLTFDEARDDAEFGAYLCDAPAGFAEQSFRRSPEQLRAWFAHGYDYVEWYVRAYTELDAPCLTSIADTENYDLSLYSFPLAESVPFDKQAIVDHPIFHADELTLETVYKRAYRLDDAGDTPGWRISFCVLYDGTLVQVNTKGVSPEWVYEQLTALRQE